MGGSSATPEDGKTDAMVNFKVPGPPQGKGRGRIVRKGGHVLGIKTPDKTVAYESLIAYSANIAMAGRAPLIGPVACMILMDCPIPVSWSHRKRQDAISGFTLPTVKPDADNAAKAILDGCNGIVFKDDAQITDLVIRKRYSEVACMHVVLWAKPGGSQP